MLTKKAKYALNALVHIAREGKEQSVGTDEIAAANNIPRKFLEGILTDLVKSGILSSRKGKGGGYSLRRAPEEVKLVEILRMFDGAIGLIPCVTYQYYKPCEECEDPETCKIRFTFKELRDINVQFMKEHSLQDFL